MKKEIVEKKQKEDDKENLQNFRVNLLAAICIILFAVAIAPKSLQNDTFYTIKVGEYIRQHGIFNLTEDTFSWHELPYTYPHWLYDLGMYFIYNHFGQFGIYVSTIVFTAVLGGIIYLTSSRFSKNKITSFVITMFAMYMMKPYIAARAQLVTFILFALTIYFIEKFLETHNKKCFIPLILIPILITNLHCAVFPFYFVLYLPYIAEYLIAVIVDLDLDYRIIKLILKLGTKMTFLKESIIEKWNSKIEKIPEVIEKKRARREEKRENPYKIKIRKDKAVLWLILIVVITAFTGFINPTGTGAYTYTYKIYQGNTTGSINEHLPVTLIDSKEFLYALCLFLAILIFTDTKIKLPDLFMLGGLMFLALKSRRQISMFVIFCAPILVKLIASLIEKYDKNTYKKVFKIISSSVCVLLIIAGFSLNTFDELKKMKSNNTTYVDEGTYPVEASTWILENLDISKMKIYNEYNYGSYLLFRGIPVFIDSRCDLYSPEFNKTDEDEDGRDIFSDALNIAGIAVDYNNMFEDYGVTHVISYSNSKLVMLLKEDNKYKKIYEDDHFSIFERLKK